MIQLIPFYRDATHLDNFTAKCEETGPGVCALPTIKGKRREREKTVEVWARGVTPTDVTFDSHFLLSANPMRIIFRRSSLSCKARDFSSYKAVVPDMSRQACSKTAEKQGIKENKLGRLSNAFRRPALKLEVNISMYPRPSSISQFIFHCVLLMEVSSTTEKGSKLSYRSTTLRVQHWKTENAPSWVRWHPRARKPLRRWRAQALSHPPSDSDLSSKVHPVIFCFGHWSTQSQRVDSFVPLPRHIRLTEIFLPKITIFFLLPLMNNIWMMLPSVGQVPSAMLTMKKP